VRARARFSPTVGLADIGPVARGARRGRGSAGRQSGELKTWESARLCRPARACRTHREPFIGSSTAERKSQLVH